MAEVTPKTPAEVAELHSNHPDILQLAKYGYGLLGAVLRKQPDELFRKRYCGGVTSAFYETLPTLGYDPWVVTRARGFLQPHKFIGLESDSGWVWVDGAWQQFVARRKRIASLPKIAVGTPDEVVDLAAKAGVREPNLAYWATECSEDISYELIEHLEPPPDFVITPEEVLVYRALAEF